MFQFLIGRLGTQKFLNIIRYSVIVSIPYRQARYDAQKLTGVEYNIEFQFLIGRLGTTALILSLQVFSSSFNSLQVGQVHFPSLYTSSLYIVFQFLIGRLGTSGSIQMIQDYQQVSIPYRQARYMIYIVIQMILQRFNSLQVGQVREEVLDTVNGIWQFQFLIGRLGTFVFPSSSFCHFCFNSLQVGQVLPTILLVSHSLPCFNSLQVGQVQVYCCFYFAGCFVFQFLIGRLGTRIPRDELKVKIAFQFLIGRLGTK